tara:strand:- start:2282 stop:2620 length:339 start_codon:yes stop_codon:yes gene_type:complete
MTDKPIFENLFINDKYQKEMDALFERAKEYYDSEGKKFPLFQNNNFLSSPEATPQSISVWLNEKDGKKFVTYKKEQKKEMGSYTKQEKPKSNEYNQDKDTSVFGQKDDDLPF